MMIKPAMQVLSYIFHQNNWYEVPVLLAKSLNFQLKKRLFKKPTILKLNHDTLICLFPDCPISSQFVYTRVPDKKEITLLQSVATLDTVFLDIGAHMGSYSLLMKNKVKHVYAFEPHPETARRCKLNFILNKLQPTQVIENVVSDTIDLQYFSDSPASPLNHIQTQSKNGLAIPALTVDSFLSNQNMMSENVPILLKIDVEGFEEQVLLGAEQALNQKQIKGIIFECFEDKQDSVIKLLQQKGYRSQAVSQNNFFAVPVT